MGLFLCGLDLVVGNVGGPTRCVGVSSIRLRSDRESVNHNPPFSPAMYSSAPN